MSWKYPSPGVSRDVGDTHRSQRPRGRLETSPNWFVPARLAAAYGGGFCRRCGRGLVVAPRLVTPAPRRRMAVNPIPARNMHRLPRLAIRLAARAPLDQTVPVIEAPH